MKNLIDKLATSNNLTDDEFTTLISDFDSETREYSAKCAREISQKYYSNKVYIRGLIEFSNICKNDCYYCGIRKSNPNANRYRLTKQDILDCCKLGYSIGFRTFVLQGGEDGYFTDDVLCDIIKSIKLLYPDCAITISAGERGYDSFKLLKDAGADRYLLRHETASAEHYNKLHPKKLSLENRIKDLHSLKELGYQVGCGFMVGSPFQTIDNLVADLRFIKEFSPQMVGIGPFIPHSQTPFKDYPQGDVELTLFLLSLIRLLLPKALLPATTALGTAKDNGREMGILHGANVVMPNLSPNFAKSNYTLYNNKLNTGCESTEGLEQLNLRFNKIGYEIDYSRGDYPAK